MKKINLQLIMACLLSVVGIVLLFSGFWVSPEGEVHESVLVAFGESMTFAGALFGVDYTYKYKITRHLKKRDNNENSNAISQKEEIS